MGAWIEIATHVFAVGVADTSLPIWERGLKLMLQVLALLMLRSLPIWERGLKSCRTPSPLSLVVSLPIWERGLKCICAKKSSIKVMSLPIWERGLKSIKPCTISTGRNVAPYIMGAWIEIGKQLLAEQESSVAPYMGAWIEIV